MHPLASIAAQVIESCAVSMKEAGLAEAKYEVEVSDESVTVKLNGRFSRDPLDVSGMTAGLGK